MDDKKEFLLFITKMINTLNIPEENKIIFDNLLFNITDSISNKDFSGWLPLSGLDSFNPRQYAKYLASIFK